MHASCEPTCSGCLCTGIAAPAWHGDREREDGAVGQLLEERSANLPIQEKALCPHNF